ncbi:cation diffusion facilitator family transporter [uncultured Prevotella sp.]|uniref:cation diffusion facilitator family transporter n=1 Tax=uncultured Prevotella sp. TaxID=159272 RepID=UPI0027E34909|nr:cation diffusion facilitator family transporter [uncultured Prevotella sp.]
MVLQNEPCPKNVDTADDTRERRIYRVTLYGAIANVLLCAAKLLAGVFGRSSAMIADGVHSLSDLITDFIVIAFVRISSKPQDRGHEYGHGKYETLATTVIGLMLLFVGAGIMWNSLSQIWAYLNGEQLKSPGWIAFVAAIVSIVVKEALFQYTQREGRRVNSQAVIANAWHHRSDAFSSIGTAIGIGGALLMGQHWTVLDPIAALIVSVLIIHAAIEQLRPSLGELVENSLPEPVEEEICKAILSCQEVSDPHNLRTRKIGNRSSVDVHVRMDGNMPLSEAHKRATEVENKIRQLLGKDTFVMIHIEPKK